MSRKNIERAVAKDIERAQQRMKEALALTPQLASKLASVIVHADEMLSPSGHHFDKTALEQALRDPDVREWIKALGPLTPLKR